ncbi:MAG: trypsin-like peptidase domain-containing protein [Chloroflexi bacterium]|nr:trypsin-like peptidase domain-containing protein [Chloroflexota bacterium]
MSHSLRSVIVRIRTADDIIVGAGFLVVERIVLTCAHVVGAALERSIQTIPPDIIHLDFPLSATKQKMTAKAVYWKPKQQDETGDIASLEIVNPTPMGVQPINLAVASETWGRSFRAFGFPPGHDDGVWASGVLRDKKANGHIQIEDVKTPGFSIGPGFSGTAVWDEELQAVVGMIVTAERKAEVKAAFMIPGDQLLEVVPASADQVIIRSELATLQANLNQILQQLLQDNKSLPQLAYELKEATRQVEKITAILDEHFSRMESDSRRVSQLQYLSEIKQANQAIAQVLRRILNSFRSDIRFQYQASLITQLNRLVESLMQLQDLLV